MLLPEPSEPVILSFDVYNHTQGFLTNFKKTKDPGDLITIKISDLDVEEVDENRMVVRADRFGAWVAFSQKGVVQFEAPKANKSYTLLG